MKSKFHEREMVELLKRFLDLCPRMNEDDPIGPALRDCCHDTKRLLDEIRPPKSSLNPNRLEPIHGDDEDEYP